MTPPTLLKPATTLLAACVLLGAAALPSPTVARRPPRPVPAAAPAFTTRSLENLRLAIEDLARSFPGRYPRGAEFLQRLRALETQAAQADPTTPTAQAAQAASATRLGAELARLRREALLANPLLDFDRLLVLKRKRGQLGLPTNHQCNYALPQGDYDNEIAILSPARPGGTLTTLFRPPSGQFVGEIDLHWDADRLLFTMPNGRTWQVHELPLDGRPPRQVTPEEPEVDNFDACYLPDGRIVFTSTAAFTGVPCWHGKERACCLYEINADGRGRRQLCFDQDLDLNPAVLENGQVIYSRWDYTGPMHAYLRPLLVMNPDGTNQRAIYGSNDYYPNCLFFPRAVPGQPTRLAAILSGYHGTNRSGELVVLDTAQGWQEAKGIVHRIGHRGEPIVPEIRDNLVGGRYPQFLHPWPLSGKYLLAAMQPKKNAPWGIWLVDAFDNMVPLLQDDACDFFEPIPVKPRPRPRLVPDRVDLARRDATVYLHDVYAGPGLAGVPRGAVKRLRLLAYDFGYPNLAGPDLIGHGGPWDAMRILGTVPVQADGSAFFRVPACTPLSIQPLDAGGKALALMRSWYTAMPGEAASCIGCHEPPGATPPARTALAARQAPVDITPWRGPARGFDFEREVQPVLDKFCAGCHDGQQRGTDGQVLPDLRAARFATAYQGLPLSKLGAERLHPLLRERLDLFPLNTPDHKLIGDRRTLYTPAYDVLVKYIRRVNVEDHVGLLNAGEYHADTSELVQMLQKGHHGARLDEEGWDRLITWIDLNGPCHGTWRDVAPIPGDPDRRRRELALKYGGPQDDPEMVHDLPRPYGEAEVSSMTSTSTKIRAEARTPNELSSKEARRRQRAKGKWEKTVDLGAGVALRLVRIPAGEFVMGDDLGEADEAPAARVAIGCDFWMSACEITNAQLRRLMPDHSSGSFMKRSLTQDGPGVPMEGSDQPAVRVSWREAMDCCRKMSQKTGLRFTLPTEAQWEYACRAGSAGPLNYGEVADDFSRLANLADAAFTRIHEGSAGLVELQEYPAITQFDDGGIATVAVGSYAPNAWGLYDMHGNAAEWTRSEYRPYPYADDDGRNTDGRNAAEDTGRKVVRGGSFHDRPARARSAFRLAYPAWQRVHNVGFRVVAEEHGD